MPRRLVITKAGSPSVLDVIEMSMPTPNEGEVCIEVHYAGINFADTPVSYTHLTLPTKRIV